MTPQELKISILQLSIKGELVKQDISDYSVNLFIENIRKSREKFSKNLNKQNDIVENNQKMPFKIPNNWQWIKFNEICDFSMGQTILTSEMDKCGDPVYSATIDDLPLGYIKHAKNKICLTKGDYVIPARGNSIGYVTLIKSEEYASGTQTTICVKNKYKKNSLFIYFYLMARRKELFRYYGAAIPQITISKISNILIPLPPLEEQKRIIAKIEELMLLVDKYEVVYNKLQTLNKQFPIDLKKAVLQFAMEGKLVKQKIDEGTGEKLYEIIKKEKNEMINKQLIKKEKEIQTSCTDEIPYLIPKSWRWVNLSNIGVWRSGATPLKSEPKYYHNGNIPWLLTGDLNNGYIDNVPNKITELALEETGVKLNPIGSVLIAMYGATIGKVAILNIPCTTNQACCACVCAPSLYNKFLFYFLIANKKNFTRMSEGGAQPNISKEKICRTLFPLPPLNEQKRIVAKIEELFKIIDNLTIS